MKTRGTWGENFCGVIKVVSLDILFKAEWCFNFFWIRRNIMHIILYPSSVSTMYLPYFSGCLFEYKVAGIPEKCLKHSRRL